MAETIVDHGSGPKWHWYNVQKDLVDQGGLNNADVLVDPFSVREQFCAGRYMGKPFTVTWLSDTLLMVSSKEYMPKLIDAFAKVVEYKPFAKYLEPYRSLVTVEWAKHDAKERFQELKNAGTQDLEKIMNNKNFT